MHITSHCLETSTTTNGPGKLLEPASITVKAKLQMKISIQSETIEQEIILPSTDVIRVLHAKIHVSAKETSTGEVENVPCLTKDIKTELSLPRTARCLQSKASGKKKT